MKSYGAKRLEVGPSSVPKNMVWWANSKESQEQREFGYHDDLG